MLSIDCNLPKNEIDMETRIGQYKHYFACDWSIELVAYLPAYNALILLYHLSYKSACSHYIT